MTDASKSLLKLDNGNRYGAITNVKWVEEQVLAVSMTNGSVQLRDLRIDL